MTMFRGKAVPVIPPGDHEYHGWQQDDPVWVEVPTLFGTGQSVRAGVVLGVKADRVLVECVGDSGPNSAVRYVLDPDRLWSRAVVDFS
jgi:hypothetical protein